jgi:hypothetical protein
MAVSIFGWNPFRFHCYGVPRSSPAEDDLIYIADLFPAWLIPGLYLHEAVELRSGSHRLAVCAEILLYNIAWPLYHLNYLLIIRKYPLSNKLFI